MIRPQAPNPTMAIRTVSILCFRPRAFASCASRSSWNDLPGVVLPEEAPWRGRHVYHPFVLRLPDRDRDKVAKELAEQAVQAGIDYPRPVHLQRAYADLKKAPGSFPHAEEVCGQILSLPIFPEMTVEQADYVAACLREILQA
jgi:dTDP-4-amino-4,6-dideoxygalactose transaminase